MAADIGSYSLTGIAAALSRFIPPLVAAAGAYAVTGQDVTFTAPAGARGPLNTTFTATSTTTGTNLPFTAGHAFKDGDVLATDSVVASGVTDFQCVPVTYWPSGCLKVAAISGRATWASPGDKTFTLTAGAAASGALTEASLASALSGSAITVTAGGFTWNVNASINTGTQYPSAGWTRRTVFSGPVMSQFYYRQPVSGSNHVVLWMEVRVYAGGRVQYWPWVENAYLNVASPTNDIRTFSVSVNGSTLFSQSIDVKHHSRPHLLSGNPDGYWVGGDPQITLKHNMAYLMASKLVPNYGVGAPSETTLAGLQTTYVPNTIAGTTDPMGTAGGSGSIIPSRQVYYITSSGDPRAYKAAIVRGLASGSYSIHYRDETTNEIFKFSSYPNASLNDGTVPAGTGGTNATEIVTHEPSFGYLPFLMTARWFFWEESAFWTTHAYLMNAAIRRRGEAYYQGPLYFASGSAFVIDTRNGAYANRGASWALNRVSQTLALCPSSHPTYQEWINTWQNNTEFYNAAFVDGTFGTVSDTSSTKLVSPQGFMGGYARYNYASNWQTSMYGEGFESNYQGVVWGFAYDIGLPQSATSLARHAAVRNQAYKQVITRAGDGSAGNYNWRRFGVFSYPYGTASTTSQTLPDTWYTGAESLAALEAGFALGSLPATAGLSLKDHSSNTDMAPGSTTSDAYFPTAFTALSMAVDHGVAGASAGWTRITGASNFTACFNSLNEGVEGPQFAIKPRNPPGLPTWRQGQAVNEFRQLSGTSLATVPFYNMGASNAPSGKQNGWSGWHIDTRTGKVYSRGSGGHDDYWGNEVDVLPLMSNAPVWSEILGPTPQSSITPVPYDLGDYYPDGRPASVHPFHCAVTIESLDRLLMFPTASRSTVGNPTSKTTSFNLITGAYDSASTWNLDATFAGAGAGGVSYAKHPTTEDVYAVASNNAIYKWTKGSPGSWTKWFDILVSFPGVYLTAAAIDPTRGTAGMMLLLGRGGPSPSPVAFVVDIGAKTLTQITSLTSSALAVTSGNGMFYSATLDKFVVRQGLTSAGDANLHFITPGTAAQSTGQWSLTTTTMTGGAALPSTSVVTNGGGGVYTKFLEYPALGGAVLGTTWGNNVWFVRLY